MLANVDQLGNDLSDCNKHSIAILLKPSSTQRQEKKVGTYHSVSEALPLPGDGKYMKSVKKKQYFYSLLSIERKRMRISVPLLTVTVSVIR